MEPAPPLRRGPDPSVPPSMHHVAPHRPMYGVLDRMVSGYLPLALAEGSIHFAIHPWLARMR